MLRLLKLRPLLAQSILIGLFLIGLFVLEYLLFEHHVGMAQSGQMLYVATDGDDANLGTLEFPFGTIQHAVYSAAPGDTVYVRGGTYHESVQVTVSGTITEPIRILAYNTERPVIDGQYLLPGGPPATPSIINNPPIPPEEFVWSPLVRIRGNHIEFRGFEIVRSRGRGIGIHGTSNAYNHDVIVSDCIVRGARTAGIHHIFTENVLIERCEVTDAGNYGPFARSPFELNWPVIVNVRNARQVTVRQSRIHHNWGEGIAAGRDSEQVVIEDNLIYNNFAMQVYVHRAQQVTVQRNFAYHTNASKFQRDSNPSDCIVVNNESSFINSLTVDQVSVINNVLVGCLSLFAIWGSGANSLVENVTFEQNTLVNAFANSGPEDAAAISILNSTVTNIVIRNNVISQQGFLLAVALQNPEVQFSQNAWSTTPPPAVSSPDDWVGGFQLSNPNGLLGPGSVQVDWYKPGPTWPVTTTIMGPVNYITSDQTTGCSSWPLTVCIPPAVVPTAPYNVVSPNSPTFLWYGVDSATSYTLVVYDVNNDSVTWTETVSLDVCTGVQCAAQPVGLVLEPGTYQWLVQANNPHGSGPWSIYRP